MTGTVAEAPQTPKTSIWEDFVDIFYAPATVYERRRDGRYGPALLAYVLAGLVLFFVFRGMWEAVTSAAVETALRNNPNIQPDQMAAARANAQKFGLVGGIFQTVVVIPIAIALTAAIVWLVGKLFGARENFAQAMTVATYANLPRLLGVIVSGALFAAGQPSEVLSPFSITVSPLRLMNEATLSPIVTALVSRFDLFTLWATVLIAIGVRVIGRVSTVNAALTAAITWLLATGFTAASAARQMGG